jgi:hypothetical protein
MTMTRRTIARMSLALAMSAAPIALIAAPASADAPHPAPLCGALNMIEASPAFYGDNAVSDGMDIAMSNLSRDGVTSGHGQSINGYDNMFQAVAVSSGAQSPRCQG